jgi:hypothetical protein
VIRCCRQTLVLRAVILVIFLMGRMTANAQSTSIQFENGSFKVVGWKVPSPASPAGWSSVFVVYTGTGDVPPLLGSYAVEGGTLVFHPAFPISAGVKYRAVFHAPGIPTVEKTFDGPPRDTTPSARVEHIYPSADVLPSNQLRLYIYFSAPMSRGVAAQYVHIYDENGKVLQGNEAAFLPSQELWDPAFQRLTMTFDPGRIKRGLTSNERIGPPLAQGKRYTLAIDREWPDARGVAMAEGFRKSFTGGPAQRTPPDPKQWRVTAPKAGTSAALVVTFPTSMNYPLLLRMLQVAGPQSNVTGSVSIAQKETEWRFVPQAPWKPGDYRLVVDTGLEDLAGNHIGQPFDIDTFEKVTQQITTATISLPFRVQ